MSRDLPKTFSAPSESAVTSQKAVSAAPKPPHLSVLPDAKASNGGQLTRGQVAARLGVSVSTVRRLEGTRLHPTIDGDDVRWFDAKDIASLAAELANAAISKRNGTAATTAFDAVPTRSPGELAALVFERLEQRQSLAEIVIGLRITPQVVRELFDSWCLGLTEGQFRMKREPNAPRVGDVERVPPERLAALLSGLPQGEVTRISVARVRQPHMFGEHEYICVTELGGFHVSGPCKTTELVRRFGPGTYRVSAYGFDPSGIRWEVVVAGLRDG
jgi:hypothetical protein